MRARLVSMTLAALLAAAVVAPADAQSRKPTAREVAAVRACATKTKDDVDAGEEKCLFKLVADPAWRRSAPPPTGSWPTAFRSKG